MPLRFNDPSELMSILSNLEEDNLLQIQRMQESEEELELKRTEKKKTEEKYNNIVDELKHKERIIEQKIRKNKNERDALKTTEQGEKETLNHETLK